MGGRQRLKAADARAVLQRLDEYVRRRFGRWPDFERQTQTPHATADRWQRKAAVPDLPQLLRLAQRDPLLDLHHLLTGRRATAWLGAAELEGLLANLAHATGEARKLQREVIGVQWLPGRNRKRRAPQRRRS